MKLKAPFFIAEISANHCGNINHAKRLIKCAKDNGADAVKLQTYTPDMMTLNLNKKYFKIRHGLWKGRKLWELYEEAHTPLEWHKTLFAYAKKIKIKIFSTPFSEQAVDLLEELNSPIYKVASFEMLDFPLLERICKTKKPIILSTGTSNIKEISEAFNFIKKKGNQDITLLYCVSNYPSKYEDFNINNIKILKKKFGCQVGLSDHSQGNLISTLSIAHGAEVFEKHIALEGQKKGIDIEFSIKGKEILKYKKNLQISFKLINNKKFYRSKNEIENRKFRRSIFVTKDIKKGEKFSTENIKRLRPGDGASPKYYSKILQLKAKRNYKKGEPLKKFKF